MRELFIMVFHLLTTLTTLMRSGAPIATKINYELE